MLYTVQTGLSDTYSVIYDKGCTYYIVMLSMRLVRNAVIILCAYVIDCVVLRIIHSRSSLFKPETKQRLPDVILIGVKKCGTEAVRKYLKIHPDMAVRMQEVHYFDRYRKKTLEWYRSQMPLSTADQLTFEKTPMYFHDLSVAARLKEALPNVKLLLVVRSPVDRAVSDYLHERQKRGWHRETFEQTAFVNVRGGIVDETVNFVAKGRYSVYLEEYIKYFDLSQIHIIDGETITRENPSIEMLKVERFLGIQPYLTEDRFVLNPQTGFYCAVADSMQQQNEREPWTCVKENKSRPHPAVNPFHYEKLRKYYKPYNERFFKLTGSKFDW